MSLYPHLLPEEVRLWNAFIKAFPNRYELYDYDHHIGRTVTLPPGAPEWLARYVGSNYLRRIDVLCWSDDQPTIVEIRTSASFYSIGQLLGYAMLWTAEHPDKQPPKLLLISDYIRPDTYQLAATYAIEVMLFPGAL